MGGVEEGIPVTGLEYVGAHASRREIIVQAALEKESGQLCAVERIAVPPRIRLALSTRPELGPRDAGSSQPRCQPPSVRRRGQSILHSTPCELAIGGATVRRLRDPSAACRSSCAHPVKPQRKSARGERHGIAVDTGAVDTGAAACEPRCPQVHQGCAPIFSPQHHPATRATAP